MQQDQESHLDSIKKLMNEKPCSYDPDQSLKRVLSHAKQQTNTRDVMSFFASWIWVLFAGFGASMHQAYHASGRKPVTRRPRNKYSGGKSPSGTFATTSSVNPPKPKPISE